MISQMEVNVVGLFTVGWDTDALAGDEESRILGYVKLITELVRSVSCKQTARSGLESHWKEVMPC